MAAVRLENIDKHYAGNRVVHGINLEIAEGEFVVLVGPSGCGKSTLMRMVAGLEDISGGDLYLNRQRANDLAAQERNIAMVFQSYALYPHLTVYDNIAFGPKLRKEPASSYKPRIEAAAAMLNLQDYLERPPKALSGGQRQRVAMARAIVREPALFLFDEPLSNLDAKLRVQMRAEIKALHQRLKNTVIYVTHDQVEAMTMGDRIVVMNGGKIEQTGKPLELYDRPANLFVAGFIGSPGMNLIEGKVVLEDSAGQRRAMLHCNGGGLRLALPPAAYGPGQALTLGIRPEHIQLANSAEAADAQLQLEVYEPTGAETYFYGKAQQLALCVASRERLDVRAGDLLPLKLPAGKIHLFDTQTGLRLET